MLISFHNKIFTYAAFAYIIVALFCFNTGFNYPSAISTTTFFSYFFIIYYSLDHNEKYYSNSRLFLTVIIYSSIIMCLFWAVSLSIDGDTFLFSKLDAKNYEKYSMEIIQRPFFEGFEYIFNKLNFDDCGAFFVMTPILRIIPNKIFLNFCYVIIGGITSIALFNTGKRIMETKYAYLAALSFSIASYTIYFHGTFLKESGFIMFVVLLFNSLYKCIDENRIVSMTYVVLYSIIICFFRPAVVVLIWLGIIIYFYLENKGATKLLISITILFIFMISIASIITIFNRYTVNGDISFIISRMENDRLPGFSNNILYALGFIGGLLGPFPTIISTTDNIRSSFYGPGLLYKLFLNIPFWYAVWIIIKEKVYYMIPMLLFIVLESITASIARKGFEFRLTYPHIAMLMLISYWCFYTISDSSEKQQQIKTISRFAFPVCFIITFFYGILR